MGLKKWMAQKGVVGSTARWAGNYYWSIKREKPEASISEIMKELISIRYTSESMQGARDTLIGIIDGGGMRGLAHLVTNILSIEASYQENTRENRFLFMDVIVEELEKLNIPDEEIYAPSNSGFNR